MTTQTLRAYLNSRPLTVPSGPDLARQHSVDPKTVTKLLQDAGYVREPHPSHAWRLPNVHTHAVESNLLDSFIKLATSSNYLLSIPQSINDSVLHKVPLTPYTTDPEDPERSKLTEAQEHWNAVLATVPQDLALTDIQRYLLFGLRLLMEYGKLPIRAQITHKGLEPFTV